VTGGNNTGPPEWVLLSELADWIATRCSLEKSEAERLLPAAMLPVWANPTNFRLRTRRRRSGITSWLPLEVDKIAGTAVVRIRHLLTRGGDDEYGSGFLVLAGMLGLDVRTEDELQARHGRRYPLEVDLAVVMSEMASRLRAAPEQQPAPPASAVPAAATADDSQETAPPEPKLEWLPGVAPRSQRELVAQVLYDLHQNREINATSPPGVYDMATKVRTRLGRSISKATFNRGLKLARKAVDASC
jgi:hypothetical protein